MSYAGSFLVAALLARGCAAPTDTEPTATPNTEPALQVSDPRVAYLEGRLVEDGHVHTASFVFLGQVVSTREDDTFRWSRIEVTDVLLGELVGATIEIRLPQGFLCPEPPRLDPGEQVLAAAVVHATGDRDPMLVLTSWDLGVLLRRDEDGVAVAADAQGHVLRRSLSNGGTFTWEQAIAAMRGAARGAPARVIGSGERAPAANGSDGAARRGR